MQLEKLLSDYKALEKNTFWSYFWNEVAKTRYAVMEALGTGTSMEESKMREKQGIVLALRDLALLPSRLAEAIQKQIEGNSEKEPQKEK